MFLHLTLTIIEYLRDLILSLFSMIYNLLVLLFTFILISSIFIYNLYILHLQILYAVLHPQ